MGSFSALAWNSDSIPLAGRSFSVKLQRPRTQSFGLMMDRTPARIPRSPTLTLFATALFLTGGCAHSDPEDFKRDDYFGGQGNFIKPKHHVPREVQRVEPWLPLF